MNKPTKTKAKPAVYLGSDHAGHGAKAALKAHLEAQGYRVVDLGGFDPNAPDDYPDFGFAVADAVAKNKRARGIAICGTGIGMSIAANKVKGVRAALVSDPKVADLAVRHDAANVLCLGARVTPIGTMREIADAFFAAKFEKGRHLRRVNKIARMERHGNKE